MIIYIRHAEDKEGKYKHDAKITEKGKKKSTSLGKKLIKKYGLPNSVLCGPMRRTIKTAKYMAKNAAKNVGSHMREDRGLSRYFTGSEQKHPGVHPKYKKRIPIGGSHEKFKERVRKHIERVKDHKGKIIWCITHTLVIKEVGNYFNVKYPEHFEFLEVLVVP